LVDPSAFVVPFAYPAGETVSPSSADDDGHPNGRNRFFDRSKPHNLLVNDDNMGVYRNHASHFVLALGRHGRWH